MIHDGKRLKFLLYVSEGAACRSYIPTQAIHTYPPEIPETGIITNYHEDRLSVVLLPT